MATFGDIAKGFDYGMNAAAKSFDGNNKYIRITDIDEVSSQYLYDDVVSPDGELEDRYLVKENDILLARTGASTGKSYLYRNSDGKLYFAGFLIRANIYKHNSYFVFSQLHTLRYKKWISVMSARSGQPGINSQEYASFPVYTTSLQEEDKIATFLKLLDERIITQNKIIEKYESLIKGLNDSLYAQYGDDVLTSFSSLGFSYSGLSGKSAQDFGSGKPFITYLNVYSNNIINEKDFQYVAIKEGEKQNVVEYGDVLFTLSSETPEEVGIGSVYLGNENVYLNSFCFGIHIINTKIAFPPYLSYYVSSTPFRKFIYPYAQGSTRFNLCKVDFEKASIKLPSLENQKRIYSILSHIESKTETEKSLLDLYNSQKQYLLRQMFI
ncbi:MULTISPECIES: restriction endonuclease subunit S [Bacteroides]|nr:restriction endonuclease subunit S [Bacteroides ovatus]KAA3813292.1 restriction endonuclease subunit S [Bacteroides ovatus]KAA3825893.1 restriction endonuclease subunit S [Bacteroides ovatus]KAA3848268.1 restriction endonuclease subunit S [Bacteroides ovatus]KAA3889484.1 restriction endonuclease subunit S [Bacteroides ovatus]MDC2452550.1 restriction endonuclease subunit S [Bacteroides ovatus]